MGVIKVRCVSVGLLFALVLLGIYGDRNVVLLRPVRRLSGQSTVSKSRKKSSLVESGAVCVASP
eukprot:265788-Amphidinium_carterae.1